MHLAAVAALHREVVVAQDKEALPVEEMDRLP